MKIRHLLTIVLIGTGITEASAQTEISRQGSSEVMEVVPYQPVKKETLRQKFERINESGNYIGVNVRIENKVSDADSLTSYGLEKNTDYLFELGKDFSTELQSSLEIANIEVLDTAKLPIFKNTVGTGIFYDYWSTKYKVIYDFNITVNAGSVQNIVSKEWECTYSIYLFIAAYDYFIEPKKGKMKSKWLTNISTEGYSTVGEGTSSGCRFSTLEVASNAEIYQKIKEGFSPSIAKWMEKKLD